MTLYFNNSKIFIFCRQQSKCSGEKCKQFHESTIAENISNGKFNSLGQPMNRIKVNTADFCCWTIVMNGELSNDVLPFDDQGKREASLSSRWYFCFPLVFLFDDFLKIKLILIVNLFEAKLTLQTRFEMLIECYAFFCPKSWWSIV